MFFNMKIEVNEVQPLDKIVGELESQGYVLDSVHGDRFVYTNEDGSFDCFYGNHCEFHREGTLSELKEM